MTSQNAAPHTAPHTAGGTDERLRCLVTGASGYIGGRLVPGLLAAGHQVRCMARTPGKLRDQPWAGQAEVVRGDTGDAASVGAALRGMDVAYYLVHALRAGNEFEETDRAAARTFAEQAHAAGVRRVVYLGGLTPDGVPEGELSPHLRSRAEVGEIFLRGPVPATVLRAAVIIGSGSASFEMLRYLTERLPVMVTPSWVGTRIQPIGVRDVLRYLVGSARMPGTVNRAFDVGGPDVMTYEEMMRRYATVAGLPRRLILRVPMLTPGLSSWWIGLVTPVPPSLARPLAESLRHEVVCGEHDIARYVPDPPGLPLGFDAALTLALRRVRDAQVSTRWSSAAPSGAPSDPLPTDPDWAGGSLYTDRRARPVRAEPGDLWRVIEGIGGENGWYSFPLAWAARSRRRVASGCGADGGTPPVCGRATHSTSGGWRRSNRGGCCGCAPRCDCPAWRGWRCAPAGTGRAARCTGSGPCSIRAGCSDTCTGGAWLRSMPWCSGEWPATSPGRRSDPPRRSPPGRSPPGRVTLRTYVPPDPAHPAGAGPLNPVRQGLRLDPDGAYVRRWVPELAGLKGRSAHQPWKLPAAERDRLDHPEPVIGLEESLGRFRHRRGAR
jgi:uncharacterized protein YbjT (DUF2867 family)